MPSFIQFRKVDDDLWRRVKAKAALEGTSVKAVVEQLLREWLKRKSS